jgi:hypothetical protein
MLREEAKSTYTGSIDHVELGFVVQERVKITLERPNARGQLTPDSEFVFLNEIARR